MTRNTVPVASNLLETTFLGFSVQRLLQSFALPLAPAMLCYILPLVPMLVTTPLFVAGLLVGGTIYRQVPEGQQPLAWTLARIHHKTQPTIYTWQPPAPDADNYALLTGPTEDEWLTRAVAPVPRAATQDHDEQPVENLFAHEERTEHVPSPDTHWEVP